MLLRAEKSLTKQKLKIGPLGAKSPCPSYHLKSWIINIDGYYICIGVCVEGGDRKKVQKKGKIGTIIKENEICVSKPILLLRLHENAFSQIQTHKQTNTNTHTYQILVNFE